MTVRSRAFSLITTGLLLAAAGSTSAQAPAVGDHASGFSAHGISAVISGISAGAERGLSDVKIQLLLKNETQKNVALAAIAGEVATASTSSGTQFVMRDVSGMPHCAANAPQDIANCSAKFPPDSFIEVDAGQSTGALLHFVGQGTTASGSISFSLRLMVRDLGDSDDALTNTAPNKATPPHLVVINFPLVPLTPGS